MTRVFDRPVAHILRLLVLIPMLTAPAQAFAEEFVWIFSGAIENDPATGACPQWSPTAEAKLAAAGVVPGAIFTLTWGFDNSYADYSADPNNFLDGIFGYYDSRSYVLPAPQTADFRVGDLRTADYRRPYILTANDCPTVICSWVVAPSGSVDAYLLGAGEDLGNITGIYDPNAPPAFYSLINEPSWVFGLAATIASASENLATIPDDTLPDPPIYPERVNLPFDPNNYDPQAAPGFPIPSQDTGNFSQVTTTIVDLDTDEQICIEGVVYAVRAADAIPVFPIRAWWEQLFGED